MSELFKEFRQNKGALLGLILLSLFVALALLAPLIAPHDPTEIFSDKLQLPAFWEVGHRPGFPLGTDDVGRCLLSRLLYGARTSLMVGVMVVLFSGSIGTVLGLISGYVGGMLGLFLSRMMDLLLSLPSVLMAMVVVAILGPGLSNAIVAVGVVSVPSFFRLVRSLTLQEKSKSYVLASMSFGASTFRQMFINILPNCMAPLIVQLTLGVSNGILDTAALGFLGLGAQPPTPEWGTMLSDAKSYIESNPILVILPGLCILLTVVALNLMGDGLRDALDPKLRKGQ